MDSAITLERIDVFVYRAPIREPIDRKSVV